MKTTSFLSILFALLCAAACPLMTGCGQQGSTSAMSKEEESHFKGGPMPPEAAKAMAAQMKKANEQRAVTGGAPGGPSPSPAAGNP